MARFWIGAAAMLAWAGCRPEEDCPFPQPPAAYGTIALADEVDPTAFSTLEIRWGVGDRSLSLAGLVFPVDFDIEHFGSTTDGVLRAWLTADPTPVDVPRGAEPSGSVPIEIDDDCAFVITDVALIIDLP